MAARRAEILRREGLRPPSVSVPPEAAYRSAPKLEPANNHSRPPSASVLPEEPANNRSPSPSLLPAVPQLHPDEQPLKDEGLAALLDSRRRELEKYDRLLHDGIVLLDWFDAKQHDLSSIGSSPTTPAAATGDAAKLASAASSPARSPGTGNPPASSGKANGHRAQPGLVTKAASARTAKGATTPRRRAAADERHEPPLPSLVHMPSLEYVPTLTDAVAPKDDRLPPNLSLWDRLYAEGALESSHQRALWQEECARRDRETATARNGFRPRSSGRSDRPAALATRRELSERSAPSLSLGVYELRNELHQQKSYHGADPGASSAARRESEPRMTRWRGRLCGWSPIPVGAQEPRPTEDAPPREEAGGEWVVA